MKPIVIIDYGMGNLFSVEKKLKQLKASYEIGNTLEAIERAGKIILPGVGHFAKAVTHLKEKGLWEALNRVVLEKRVPILGICLGMQLMTSYSEEGNCAGLGWFPGKTVRFKVDNPVKFKVPHTGWNGIIIQKKSALMKNIPEDAEFYFVHAYHYSNTKGEEVLNTCIYEKEFACAIQRDHIFGVQYHPEKSHEFGKQLIKNFIEL